MCVCEWNGQKQSRSTDTNESVLIFAFVSVVFSLEFNSENQELSQIKRRRCAREDFQCSKRKKKKKKDTRLAALMGDVHY